MRLDRSEGVAMRSFSHVCRQVVMEPTDCSVQPPTAASAVERDVLMYRSYIAQKKYSVVLDEVLDSSPAEVKAVRLLAQYLHSPSKR